jgi:sRNA-binding regulator protein Hfq
MENFVGKMVKNILENLRVIKEKVKVYLVGVMAVYMRDNGVTVSSMVREFS